MDIDTFMQACFFLDELLLSFCELRSLDVMEKLYKLLQEKLKVVQKNLGCTADDNSLQNLHSYNLKKWYMGSY